MPIELGVQVVNGVRLRLVDYLKSELAQQELQLHWLSLSSPSFIFTSLLSPSADKRRPKQ